MVQKVTGSIPVSHPTLNCGYSTAVSISVFQTEDGGSIPPTRTIGVESRLVGRFFVFMVQVLTILGVCGIMRVL